MNRSYENVEQQLHKMMDGGLHEKEKTDLNPVTRKLYEIDENQTAIDMVSIDKESISNGRPHARPLVEPHLRLLFRSTYLIAPCMNQQ